MQSFLNVIALQTYTFFTTLTPRLHGRSKCFYRIPQNLNAPRKWSAAFPSSLTPAEIKIWVSPKACLDAEVKKKSNSFHIGKRTLIPPQFSYHTDRGTSVMMMVSVIEDCADGNHIVTSTTDQRGESRVWRIVYSRKVSSFQLHFSSFRPLTLLAMATLQVPMSQNGSHKQTTKQYWAEERSRTMGILAGERRL